MMGTSAPAPEPESEDAEDLDEIRRQLAALQARLAKIDG